MTWHTQPTQVPWLLLPPATDNSQHLDYLRHSIAGTGPATRWLSVFYPGPKKDYLTAKEARYQ